MRSHEMAGSAPSAYVLVAISPIGVHSIHECLRPPASTPPASIPGTLEKGRSDGSPKRIADLKTEIMFVWGRQDTHVPYAGRQMICARLEEVDARYEWHEVNAQHAFLRDEGPRYDAVLFLRSVMLMLDFYRRAMSGRSHPQHGVS